MSPVRGRAADTAAGRSGGPRLAARAERLTKVYGSGDTEVSALRGIDLDFPRGRFTAIMGPSGSGKSTLMHCLAGLDTVSGGRVFIGDVELSRLSDRQLTQLRRDRIGFIFQQFNLLPTLTAAENITLPLDIAGRRADKKWMQLVVDAVGLAPRLNHKPTELSGGQQQRVACARALITRPDIIFGDEPTGNLDSASGAEVLSFLRDSVRELGQTVVMVTHDPKAASYADEVIFLADGRIVDTMLEPTADAVLDRMKNLDQPGRGRPSRRGTTAPRAAGRDGAPARRDTGGGRDDGGRAGWDDGERPPTRRRPTMPPPGEGRRSATGANAARVPTGPGPATGRRGTGAGAGAGAGAGGYADPGYRRGTGPARDGRGPARPDLGAGRGGPPPARGADGYPVVEETDEFPLARHGAEGYPPPRRATGGYPPAEPSGYPAGEPSGGYPPAEPVGGYPAGEDTTGYPAPGPPAGEQQPPWRAPYRRDTGAPREPGPPGPRRGYGGDDGPGQIDPYGEPGPYPDGYGPPASGYAPADGYSHAGYGEEPNGHYPRGGYPPDDTESYGVPNGYGAPEGGYQPRPAPRSGYRPDDARGDQDGREAYEVDRYDGRYETGGYETGRWT
ncbi:ATP-binding cassette domain-containing protein [Pseudofrankia sp. BMG5.37]|uniref:ATP-binding cassette domain-containing protein n=1 Tax=Pseudofrankia sp. BMG5.37 TaxID=3050035 RepID=UPI0037C4FC59